jgi:GTP-binding protein
MMKILDSTIERTVFAEKELLDDNVKKVIFIGRSNVGKSSLINKLVGRKKLARTSSKPGKTISVNYYRIEIPGDYFYFVDLPGYGFARISKTENLRVKSLLSVFFNTVKNVKLVILLVDSRRGFMESDLETISEIVEKKFRILTVLTKSDKLAYSKLIGQKKDLQKKFGLAVTTFTVKSDENKEEMLNIINNAITE